ncbi:MULTISPECIES: hypothetical protein [Cryobacterium]|uniref:YtxH domain-containing protein n=1 Tax=Cryobacterium zongtaii TaxID=1259217 RepID=A0A2S3ZHU2_9MICO|nr:MULTISPECIES: hypothetical protein [Cryobacterium]ASD20774.1 hypothetical protein B7495_00490 [Cryobacterium sp. LW097]POH66976.1 hypothetical protein C3B61_07905 [Cryobacterium zongtaii]POH67183.1 hypothetical protein C3B60_08795 [Cryobacterium zongtaii]TFC43910.1 hypothetical protein E3O57_11770 [Cryobacterium sp. TMN-39-2]TFC50536.1 hypothetical protein E3O68_17080 [Cryobacterium sp. TMB3-1-2]
MRGKLLFITGGLVGYVLGARAGRQRYDQIASAASDLWNRPPVQRRVNEVKDFALERVGDVPGALYEAGKKVASAVSNKTDKTKGAPATGTSGAATAATKAAASATKSAKAAADSATSAADSAKAADDTSAAQ